MANNVVALFETNTFSRRDTPLLNRLLIGHSHLTHSYLLNKDPALHVNTVNAF